MTSFHDKTFDAGTQLKLEIFRGYIREWLPVFLTGYTGSRSNYGNVNIFDFFAGPGQDADGNPGSPLIIVDELRQFCQDRSETKASRTDVQLLFNDADADKIQRLKVEVAKIACQRGCCKIAYSTLPFSDALRANLKTIQDGNSASLVIMDQCGVKEVTLEVVQQLAACRTTDILFFVSSSYLRRFAEAPEFAGKFDVEAEHVKSVDYNNIHRFVCNYFRERLGGQRYYMAPFSIRKGGNTYGVIFGSGSLLGLQKFLRICWDKDKVTGEANYNIDGDFAWSGQRSLFQEQNTITKVTLFQHELKCLIREESPNNHDVYEFCLTKGFLPSHALEVLRPMSKDGTLELCDLCPELPTRMGAFYLTWDEYRKNPPRVKFAARSGT